MAFPARMPSGFWDFRGIFEKRAPGVREAICKTPTRYSNSVKLVFTNLLKGIKIEINKKVSCLKNPPL